MITWSRHSRRIEPIILSTYGLCHGERGAVRTSSIPIARTRFWKQRPYDVIARCGVPRKGLGDLSREPNLHRVLGNLEMDDSPSMVIKYNHGIEHPKRRGRDDEHVDRDDDCHMVPQKAAPSRGGSLRAPRQIPSNGGLTDLDAELEEFAVDTRWAPKRVVAAHLTDQVAYFVTRLGPCLGPRDRHRQ
jgi:hypothetical protein